MMDDREDQVISRVGPDIESDGLRAGLWVCGGILAMVLVTQVVRFLDC